MKIAFFWTGEFSKNILSQLYIDKRFEILLAVSQADKPVWRKKEVLPTPVKAFALEKNIPVSQPDKLSKDLDFLEKLKSLDLDFIVVVAYGKIMPEIVLNIPKFWSINLHGSILPKYRWASPIQESLKNWDTETGLTVMYMSKWMDEWDIIKIEKVEIEIKDNTNSIFGKFQSIWGKLLWDSLENIYLWKAERISQDSNNATYCSKIEKEEWEINFKDFTAKQIYDKFRAYSPWPWIFTYYKEKKLIIEDCFFEETDLEYDDDFGAWDVIELESHSHDCEDEHCHHNEKSQIWILCKNWILTLKRVKLEWKKSISIYDFLNWNKDFLDYSFS